MSLDFLTKRRFLLFATIGTVVFLLLVFLGTNFCYRDDLCRVIRRELSHDSLFFTILFPGFLVLSLITYPLRDRVFTAWKWFAVFAVPVVLMLTIPLTLGTGGGFTGIDFTLFFLSLLYGTFFLISLIIIIVTWWRGK